MPVRSILSNVWVRLSLFSQLSIMQYMGWCVFSLPISLVMIEIIYTLSYQHHQIRSVNYYPLFRVRYALYVFPYYFGYIAVFSLIAIPASGSIKGRVLDKVFQVPIYRRLGGEISVKYVKYDEEARFTPVEMHSGHTDLHFWLRIIFCRLNRVIKHQWGTIHFIACINRLKIHIWSFY